MSWLSYSHQRPRTPKTSINPWRYARRYDAKLSSNQELIDQGFFPWPVSSIWAARTSSTCIECWLNYCKFINVLNDWLPFSITDLNLQPQPWANFHKPPPQWNSRKQFCVQVARARSDLEEPKVKISHTTAAFKAQQYGWLRDDPRLVGRSLHDGSPSCSVWRLVCDWSATFFHLPALPQLMSSNLLTNRRGFHGFRMIVQSPSWSPQSDWWHLNRHSLTCTS
jgi:hypothetical protein